MEKAAKDGCTYDAQMLAQSDLVARLRAMRNRLGVLICIYGDLACPISDVLLRPPKGNNFTSHV
eukprot:scaffold246_cov364-Pavlova_lutheri.AAC.4